MTSAGGMPPAARGASPSYRSRRSAPTGKVPAPGTVSSFLLRKNLKTGVINNGLCKVYRQYSPPGATRSGCKGEAPCPSKTLRGRNAREDGMASPRDFASGGRGYYTARLSRHTHKKSPEQHLRHPGEVCLFPSYSNSTNGNRSGFLFSPIPGAMCIQPSRPSPSLSFTSRLNRMPCFSKAESAPTALSGIVRS